MAILESRTQTGLSWVKESIALFKQSPRKWLMLALFYITFFVMLPSALHSIIFVVLTILIFPVFVVLAMMMYRNVERGTNESLSAMMTKLQPKMSQLMLLGLVSLLYGILISYLLSSDMQWLAKVSQMMQAKTPMSEQQASLMIEKGLPIMLKMLLFSAPLLVVTWFSPMLIAFNDYPLAKAIKSSIAGAIQYAVAMTAAGLVLVAGLVLLMLVLGIFAGLMGKFMPAGAQFFMSFLIFGWLLLTTALMLAFQYVSYRDVFRAA